MNRNLYRLGTFTLALIAATSLIISNGCSSKRERKAPTGPITANTVVAAVDDSIITLGEVLSRYESLTAPGYNVSATPENALNEVLYRKAAYLAISDFKDYDKNEIHRLAKNRTHDVLMSYLFQQVITNNIKITDAEVDSAYQANIYQYSLPERRSVTHLLISSNPKAWAAAGVDVSGLGAKELDAKAKAECTRLYQEAKEGSDLGDLAAKYTHDSASKPKRGSSGLITRGQMVEEFDKVAFKLPKGAISQPFKTMYGWHILRVDEILDSTIEPLSKELSTQIRTQLRMARETRLGQQYVDSCAQAAEIVWNDALLQGGKGALDAKDWIAIVNRTDTIPANLLSDAEALYRTKYHKDNLDPETRKDIIRGQSSPFILDAAARKLGLMESDTIKAVYRAAYNDELVTRIFRTRYGSDAPIKEEDMKSYYDAHLDDFQSKKPLKVQHIVFQDSLTAGTVLEEVRKGADFKEEAMKHYPGEQDFKEVAFDLGWIGPDDISPDFFNAAWIIEIGKYTGPVHTQYGYHIIKVVDRKPLLEFAAARPVIGERLRKESSQKANEEWLKKILKGRDVVRYDEILKQVDFKKPELYAIKPDSLMKSTGDTLKSGS